MDSATLLRRRFLILLSTLAVALVAGANKLALRTGKKADKKTKTAKR